MGGVKRLSRRLKTRLFNAFNRQEYAVVRGVRLLSLHPAISPAMRFVLFNRAYEDAEAELLAFALDRDDRVLEVGAAIGFLGCYAQTALGVRAYAMVEANPALIPVIEANQQANGVNGLVVYAAAAPTDGPVSFAAATDFWASSLNADGRLTVEGRTLPSLVAALPFRPNVLVLDIEGGEVELPPEHFDGFDKVVMETHPGVVGEAATARLLRGLAQRGLGVAARRGGVVLLTRGRWMEADG